PSHSAPHPTQPLAVARVSAVQHRYRPSASRGPASARVRTLLPPRHSCSGTASRRDSPSLAAPRDPGYDTPPARTTPGNPASPTPAIPDTARTPPGTPNPPAPPAPPPPAAAAASAAPAPPPPAPHGPATPPPAGPAS